MIDNFFKKQELKLNQRKRLDNIINSCLKTTDIKLAEKHYNTITSILGFLCHEKSYKTIEYDEKALDIMIPYIMGLEKGKHIETPNPYIAGYEEVYGKKEACVFYLLGQTLNKDLFEKIRNINDECDDDINKCVKCDGITLKCDNYIESNTYALKGWHEIIKSEDN